MDFGAIPPEINSGRMYSGPGAGSMLAAAVAWDGLATEIYCAATDYSAVTSGLAYRWQGVAATAIAQAAAPYTAWPGATAGQAERAAAQAKAAAGAHDAAFAATVPPPVISANRTLLTSLVATNALGQNGPAIANPFSPPPVTTDPAGLGVHAQDILAAGSQLISAVPQALAGLASSPRITSVDTVTSWVSSRFELRPTLISRTPAGG